MTAPARMMMNRHQQHRLRMLLLLLLIRRPVSSCWSLFVGPPLSSPPPSTRPGRCLTVLHGDLVWK
jgi:hypothetical protein